MLNQVPCPCTLYKSHNYPAHCLLTVALRSSIHGFACRGFTGGSYQSTVTQSSWTFIMYDITLFRYQQWDCEAHANKTTKLDTDQCGSLCIICNIWRWYKQGIICKYIDINNGEEQCVRSINTERINVGDLTVPPLVLIIETDCPLLSKYICIYSILTYMLFYKNKAQSIIVVKGIIARGYKSALQGDPWNWDYPTCFISFIISWSIL